VRGIYRLALRRLARRGWSRAAHEAPEEYLRRLPAAWAGVEPGGHPGPAGAEGGSGEAAAPRTFAALTAAFVADCYGPPRTASPGPFFDWQTLRVYLDAVKRRNKA
jgi:hypothetical protein